jgi:hypothetical protein
MRFVALFGFFGWRRRNGGLFGPADQDGRGDDRVASSPRNGFVVIAEGAQLGMTEDLSGLSRHCAPEIK